MKYFTRKVLNIRHLELYKHGAFGEIERCFTRHKVGLKTILSRASFNKRRWPRLLDRNIPTGIERGLPKVDIIDHDNDIEVQAALLGVKKEDLDVTINIKNKSINLILSSWFRKLS